MRLTNEEISKSIENMSEKDKLKLILSGLRACHFFFACDIKCDTEIASDSEIEPIIEIMVDHNLTSSDYIRLFNTYRRGNFQPYEGEIGNFIKELEPTFKQFDTPLYQGGCALNASKGTFAINDSIGESEVAKLVIFKNEDLQRFIDTFNLTELDFMVLAKAEFHEALLTKNIADKCMEERLLPNLRKVLSDNLDVERIKEKVKRIK